MFGTLTIIRTQYCCSLWCALTRQQKMLSSLGICASLANHKNTYWHPSFIKFWQVINCAGIVHLQMKCLMRRIRIYRSSGWLYVPVQQQPFFTRSLSNPSSPPSHIFSLMKLARYQLTKVFHWSQGKKEKEKGLSVYLGKRQVFKP